MNRIGQLAFVFLGWIIPFSIFGQYAGPAGSPGSTALYKDSNAFVSWATGCTVVRGFQNIADTSLGRTSLGTTENAVGKAGGEDGVISLGDGGSATLTFAKPITNGEGPDFAVFENGFTDDFLELAFVEVSSDGQNFVRFPAVSLSPTLSQFGPFLANGKAEWLHNLGGKYRLFYGTPFDLEELKDSLMLNIDSITQVRIVDVVGSIDPAFTRYDSQGNRINDPFPTPFPSGGFDLDAVGVIHEKVSAEGELMVFPNPSYSSFQIRAKENLEEARLVSMEGRIFNLPLTKTDVFTFRCDTKNLAGGLYTLLLNVDGKTVGKRLVIRQ